LLHSPKPFNRSLGPIVTGLICDYPHIPHSLIAKGGYYVGGGYLLKKKNFKIEVSKTTQEGTPI